VSGKPGGERQSKGLSLNLVGNRNRFYLLSLIVLLPAVISLAISPRLTLGIDFEGGTEFGVRFQEPVSQSDLEDALAALGHPEARVQGGGANQYFVRVAELQGAGSAPPIGPAPTSEKDEIENALEEQFGPLLDGDGKDIGRFIESSTISESISREIGRSAGIAVAAATLAIFVYLWYTFRAVPQSFRFGTAAAVALVHDVVIVVGVFSILGKLIGTELNKEFIIAILTVIGFSVHDSIVVFDRIRENVGRGEGLTFAESVNASLLQTISRSLNTSLTLIFAILALMLMGGGSIREFLLAMLIGTVAGTYSSIFIAAQVLVTWEEDDIPRFFRRLLGRGEPDAGDVEELEPETAPG